MFQEALPERIRVGDATVEYGECGAGPDLVYLHGCDGVSLSDPFVAPLARAFRVTAISLPGFGASDLPRSIRSVRDIAFYLRAVLRGLGISRAVLVGSSFGGWVAAELGADAPELCTHLVLAAPLGARFTAHADEVEITDVFTVPTETWSSLFISRADLAETLFSGMRFADMHDEAAIRFCKNREALTVFGWSPLLHDRGLVDRLGRIDVPTLVLAAERDRVTAPAYAEKFARAIPGARFRLIEECGHYIPLERPEEFAREVADFVRGGG